MVGLEGAGEAEGSRIWGMRASWLMITGGSARRSNAQRNWLELCPCRRRGQQRSRFGEDARVSRLGPGTLGEKAGLYSLRTKRIPKASLLGNQVATGKDTWKLATDKPARELDKRYR